MSALVRPPSPTPAAAAAQRRSDQGRGCAALGFFIAALSPSMDLAAVVVSSLVSCLCYSTGNLIRVADMPAYWRWFPNVNFLFYAWAALMKNEFEGCSTVFVNNHTVRHTPCCPPCAPGRATVRRARRRSWSSTG